MPRIIPAFLTIFALTGSAFAADYSPVKNYTSQDGRVTFIGGIGYSWIKANEIVYDEGDRISHLIWDARTPIIATELGFRPTERLTIEARFKAGIFATSRMDDYDWTGPYLESYAFEDWTFHSFHESTDLERYINGDIAFGHDTKINNTATLNLNGGVKYLNIKFNAHAGAYTYSVGGFRNLSGPPNYAEKVISYEQRVPGVFVGARWTGEFDKALVSARARLGSSIGAKDVDNHFSRSILFIADFDKTPFVEVGANVQYSVSDRTTLYIGADYEKYFEMKGNILMKKLETGEATLHANAEGATFRSVTLTFGLKSKF